MNNDDFEVVYDALTIFLLLLLVGLTACWLRATLHWICQQMFFFMKLESDAAKAAFIVKHFSAFPPKTFRALSTSDRKELFQFFLRLAPTLTSEFHNICFQGNTRLFLLLEGLLHFKNAVSVVFFI